MQPRGGRCSWPCPEGKIQTWGEEGGRFWVIYLFISNLFIQHALPTWALIQRGEIPDLGSSIPAGRQ